MNKVFASSWNPNNISLTIKSIVKGIIALSAVIGINQITGDVSLIGDNLIELLAMGAAAWSSIEAIIGAGRKIVVFIKGKFNK
jgi:hypothetical protein